MATRRATGLEATLIDNDLRLIHALDPADTRTVTVRVAGPTSLIIAKLHKLHDRIDDDRRLADKDAGDVYRLMQTTDSALLIARMRVILDDPMAGASARTSLGYLDELFGARARPGISMATRAMDPAVPAAQIQAVCAAVVRDLLGANL